MNDTVDNVLLMKRIELEYFVVFLHVEVQLANVQLYCRKMFFWD